MAEILTESFCERCGSRYTFESEVPRGRLRGVRVLTRGFKNFVLDDKTSIDEAMAAARDDTDRALTAHQLEAFHKTFNFCMQCRQYICPNCWNDADGKCLTCAPTLGHGILPAPFPDLDPSLGVAPSDDDGLAAVAMNGHKHVSDAPDGLDAIAPLEALTLDPAATTPTPEMIGGEVEALAAAAEMETIEATSAQAAEDAFLAAEAAAVAELDDVVPPTVAITEPTVPEAEPVPSIPDQAFDAPVAVPDAIAAHVIEADPELDVTADAVPPPAEAVATPEAVVTPPTGLLLAGLRPGESLDDAIAAFESATAVPEDLAAEELEAITAADEPESEAAVETPTQLEMPALPATPDAEVIAGSLDVPPATRDEVAFGAVTESADDLWATSDEPLDEIPTAVVEPVAVEPVVVEPVALEPVVEPIVEPVVEPVAVEPVVIEPVALEPVLVPLVEAAPETPVELAPSIPDSPEIAAAASLDVVEQPTWSIVAPDPMPVADIPGPIADPAVEIAAQGAPAPAEDPDRPSQPQWPSPLPSQGLPFLGRPVVPTGGVEALWAESDRAVMAPRTGTDRPAGGVQPCVSCGLSLSGTARFCRRCGTSQVG